MTTPYDSKLVAVSALGVACFALGFSVTAVAYPKASRAPEATQTLPSESHATAHARPTGTTRGCQLGE
jgi:hypothetical protein